MTTNVKNRAMQDMLEGEFFSRRDLGLAHGRALGDLMWLPGVRGAWGMGSRDENGDVYDHTGQGRTLTNVSALTFSARNGLVPYAIHDGSADCLRRTSSAALQITTAMTMGGWFYATDATPATRQGLVGKYLTTGNQRSYLLDLLTTGYVRASISVDGTNLTVVDSTATTADATWFHAVLRYTPSSELSVFLNGVETLNTTSIPAGIFASTANFEIGAYNTGASVLNGRSTLCFLCAGYLQDAAIKMIFYNQRILFGLP